MTYKLKGNKRKTTLEKKNAKAGYMFIFPWIIGFIFFFTIPMIKSFIYTFNKIVISPSGFKLQYVGLKNYQKAFTLDPDFIRKLTGSIKNMGYQVPIIVLFSLFIAVILNQKFKGRFLMRSIFFLPVVITSGIVIQILKQDIFAQTLDVGAAAGGTVYMLRSFNLMEILIKSGLNPGIASVMTNVADNIFDLTWKAGVQILLFLAGLQAISPSLYEAAKVEGATGWEEFWKITFPMVSPIILVNIVYSVIDSFTDYGNTVMQLIYNAANKNMLFEYSATLAWIYFICVFVLLAIIIKLTSKRVFYMVE